MRDRWPSRTRRFVVVAALAALAAVAVSCGEVDIPVAVGDFADRVEGSQHIYLELSEAERECVFRREAKEIDFDLVINGTGPLAEAERTDAVRISLDCVEDPHDWDGWVQLQADNFAVGIGRGVELDEDEGRCVVHHFLDHADDPARLFAVGDGVADLETAIDAIDRCFAEENLALVYGESVAFDDYGDDPSLDLLHDQCGDGSDLSCDLLYMLSGVGTGYERFASTCADTAPATGEFCTGIQFDGDGVPLRNDPAFAEVRASCAAGDGVACDLYYVLSPFRSEEEEFGFTCGGTIPLGGAPDCRTALADS